MNNYYRVNESRILSHSKLIDIHSIWRDWNIISKKYIIILCCKFHLNLSMNKANLIFFYVHNLPEILAEIEIFIFEE